MPSASLARTLIYQPGALRAMAVRQRKAGGSSGPGAGGGESPYTELEGALREVYEAARSGRQGQLERRVELPELGDLLVEVFSVKFFARVEVLKRGNLNPLCEVGLFFGNEKPLIVGVICGELEELASRCARGEGCWLSWEEARDALGLTVWAVNRLAELAGAPAKVEKVGLVEAYGIGSVGPSVLPCLQMSIDGKRRSMCGEVHLSRYPDRSWKVWGSLRLVPIGEAHIKMVEALAELEKMVEEYKRNREREGAERIYVAKRTHARKHWGDFLGLEEVVLRLPDGAEEVLLKPWFFELSLVGEDFAVVACPASCPESSDSELADTIKKDVEEALGVVVQTVRRYTEEHDPQFAAFAYIVVEALGRAGLASA